MPADGKRPGPDYEAPRHEGQRLVEPTPNARQGVTGHHVRTILAVSTSVVIVLFAVTWFLFFAG